MFTLIGKKGFGVMVRYQEEDREKFISEGAQKIHNNKSQMQDFADLQRIKIQLEDKTKPLDPRAKSELEFLQKNLERKVSGLSEGSILQQCNDFFQTNDYVKNNKTKIIEETKARLAKGENVSEFPHLAAVFLIRAEAIADTARASRDAIRDSMEDPLIKKAQEILDSKLKTLGYKSISMEKGDVGEKDIMRGIKVTLTAPDDTKIDLGSIIFLGSDGKMKDGPTIAQEVQTKIEKMKDELVLKGNKEYIDSNDIKAELDSIVNKLLQDKKGLGDRLPSILAKPTKEAVILLNKEIGITNDTGIFSYGTVLKLKKFAGIQEVGSRLTGPDTQRTPAAQASPSIRPAPQGPEQIDKREAEILKQNEKYIKDNNISSKTSTNAEDETVKGLLEKPTRENIKKLQKMIGFPAESDLDGKMGNNTQEKLKTYLDGKNASVDNRDLKDRLIENMPNVKIKKEAIEFMEKQVINNDKVFNDFKKTTRGNVNSFVKDPFSKVFMRDGRFENVDRGDLQMKDASGFAFEKVIKSQDLLKSWRGMSDSQKNDIITALNTEWNKKAQEKISSQVKTPAKK